MRTVICPECGQVIPVPPHKCEQDVTDLYPIVLGGEVVYVAKQHLQDNPDVQGTVGLIYDKREGT